MASGYNARPTIVGTDISKVGKRLHEDTVELILFHIGAPTVLRPTMKPCRVIAAFIEFVQFYLWIPTINDRFGFLKAYCPSYHFFNQWHQLRMRGVFQQRWIIRNKIPEKHMMFTRSPDIDPLGIQIFVGFHSIERALHTLNFIAVQNVLQQHKTVNVEVESLRWC